MQNVNVQNVNALLQMLRQFEGELSQEKQQFMKKMHQDLHLMHRLMAQQMDVWSSNMMVKFKLALNRLLNSFASNNNNDNERFNVGYACESVAKMLMTDLVTNPEGNLTNQCCTGGQLFEHVQPIRQGFIVHNVLRNDDDAHKLCNILQPTTLSPIDKTNQQILQMQAFKYLLADQHTSTRPVVNLQPKQVIYGVECFKLDCEQVFNRWKHLYHHMVSEHHIDTAPCLVKDCDRTFTNIWTREKHIRTDHRNRKQCAKCSRPYINGGFLKNHYSKHHSIQYKCTVVNCTFKSEFGITVSRHYIDKHRHVSRHSACGHQFRK